MEAQDIVKQCYQGAFGAEHILQDEKKAWRYLCDEFETCTEAVDVQINEPIIEFISPDVCRINLRAWKNMSLTPEHLFEIFVKSVKNMKKDEELFMSYLKQAGEIVPFKTEFWEFVENYKQGALSPVHHSKAYKQWNNPAYRVISGNVKI